jgi:phage-related protein
VDNSGPLLRVFFTVDEPYVVLLHGYIKKSKAIPRQEINLARRRLAEWRGEG